MSENKHLTSHVEFLVLLVTLLGGFYLLDDKIETQGARTDKLYEMFVENQKTFYEEMKNIHARVSVMEYKVDSKK